MTKSTDQATSQHRDADATLMTPPLPHTRQDGHGRPGDVGDPSHAAPRSGAVRAGARVLVGRYELQQRIAVGGMAGVWRARDVVLDRIVAVKLLHEHLAVDEGFRERFRREAVTAAKLSHPHIVNLYDTGTDGEDAFLVLELVEGQTLRDLVASLGRLEPGLAAAIGEKIARALGYAHERGLVHRDVKPANILLGDDAAVKITDFGIAKADQHGDLTNTGMVLGTAAYVAPEQVLGRPVTGQADQYALGCVLYEALSGAQPFKGETAVVTAALRLEREVPPLRQLSPDVPPGLEAIVARATAREPQDRFPSLGALADALGPFVDADTNRTAALLAAHPTSDRRPSPTPTPSEGLSAPAWRARRRRVRNALPATVAALVMLAAAAVAVLGGVLDRAEDGPDATSSLAPEVLLTEDNLAVFDPGGSGGENDELLGALVDGDPETAWRTERYRGESFGFERYGKQGVGFMVDLGQLMYVDTVQLQAERPGVDVQLRFAANEPEEIGDTRIPAASRDDASGQLDLRPVGQQRPARYVVVWLHEDLPEPDEGSDSWYAAFDDLIVRARPALDDGA